MIKRFLALAIAVMMLAACSNAESSAPAASEPTQAASSSSSSSQEEGPEAPANASADSEHLKDGKFIFKQIDDPLFTMDYEPARAAKASQHFGLNFYDGIDTDWLGDSENVASFNIYLRADAAENIEKTEYGSVVLTSAPIDMKAAFGTDDAAEIAEKMKADYFTVESYYNGYKKNLVEDFGYEVVEDAFGVAYEGWNACYFEFINDVDNVRSLRFYSCNDKLDENFLSFSVRIDVPADDTEMLERLKGILFTFHLRDD